MELVALIARLREGSLGSSLPALILIASLWGVHRGQVVHGADSENLGVLWKGVKYIPVSPARPRCWRACSSLWIPTPLYLSQILCLLSPGTCCQQASHRRRHMTSGEVSGKCGFVCIYVCVRACAHSVESEMTQQHCTVQETLRYTPSAQFPL